MKFLFYLSGEHRTLPKSEVNAVLAALGINYKIQYYKNRLLIVDADTKNYNFIDRLAMVKKSAEFIIKSDNLNEISDAVSKEINNKFPDAKSFAVRCTTLDDKKSLEIEKEIGGKIQGLSNLRVKLKNPDIMILCFTDDDMYFTGIDVKIQAQKFDARKAQHRPYFSPVSMHPKIARVLVNLARIKTGDVVLDPFCGTGGILIEAGLMGMKVVGSDIDVRMVKGCKKNLGFYGVVGDIKKGDALNLKDTLPGKIDAIVTDPPYGRASYTSDKNLGEFYNNFLGSAKSVLEKGKFLVMVLPDEYELDFNSHGFEVFEFHDVRMHRSLTRRIWVLQR
ncbi:MAG: hypothetical protein CVT90_01850 [Candidatus Altiarchaeales archaeon HGW-Altiarchaeales-3]|nr:MAG: hypothetical protein CVT90_01850 [Candidatus Altiarchaeales archaeon HGW-Altiarchaeales-3]